MEAFPLDKAFGLIEPGPVVLVATALAGKPNVMTASWHMVVDFTPRLACVIGPWDHSSAALRQTKECAIAVPTVDLLDTVIAIGNCSGEDTDKFAAFSLTGLPARKVAAPLVAQCLANIECRVVDTTLADAYNLFILEGVTAWIDPDRRERRTFHANGDGTFVIDGETRDRKALMVKWQSIL